LVLPIMYVVLRWMEGAKTQQLLVEKIKGAHN